MPELPEVETVRRMLHANVRGRRIARVELSGKKLRVAVPRSLPAKTKGRTIERVDRVGKYLLVRLDRGLTLLSHLGMSGRWLFRKPARAAAHRSRARDATPNGEADLAHVHVKIAFADGSALWFQDPRRFGLLKILSSQGVDREPSLSRLGPDPIATPPTGTALRALAGRSKVSIKNFLLDQRRIAGIGNIYASEILFRVGVDPRRQAGAVRPAEWERIAREIPAVLREAIAGMGTTFSTYRTIWNEPGAYGERLLVYDRANQPCRRCGGPVRRIVQGQRSTFFCPVCQPRRGKVSYVLVGS